VLFESESAQAGELNVAVDYPNYAIQAKTRATVLTFLEFRKTNPSPGLQTTKEERERFVKIAERLVRRTLRDLVEPGKVGSFQLV
jgi:hypothetical protein